LGKIRKHIERDDHGLAQWIFRKLVNHDPMSVREKHRKTDGNVRFRHIEGTQEVEYVAGDKVFLISVQEVDEPHIPVAHA
jgi:hypothetical protein